MNTKIKLIYNKPNSVLQYVVSSQIKLSQKKKNNKKNI